MAALGRKLRTLEGGHLQFWCPGCRENHVVRAGNGHDGTWTFNGDGDRPTFRPSVLFRSGHHAPHFKKGDPCWCSWNAEHGEPVRFRCQRCHSFVTDGRIRFLADCSHDLRGKTVELPDHP